MTPEEKEKYQKRSAYVVWQLKKYLPKVIEDEQAFRLSLYKDSDARNINNANNLSAVRVLTYKAFLERIEKLEREYEKGDI